MTVSPWLLICPMLLILRAGQALYQSGVVRSKNAATTVFQSIMEGCVGILAFWAFGAAILHGTWSDLFCKQSDLREQTPFLALVVLISNSIMTGSTLGRATKSVWIASAILMCGFVTPICWQLCERNGWLGLQGFIDLQGASFIHFTGGCAAMVAAMVVGPRAGKYNRDGSTNVLLGHNVPLASTGISLMAVGWLPYVGGFALLNQPGFMVAEPRILSVLLAGAAGACGAMLFSRLRYGILDVYLIYGGLLAGLVSITAGMEFFTSVDSVIAGVVAGVLVPWATTRIDMKWKIDDPAGVIAIHGIGGLWAVICPAIFLSGTLEDHLHRFLRQAMGLGMVGVIAIGASWIVLWVLRAMVGVHVSEADEFDGLDLSGHDLNAYPDFQQTMIKSYHLREM